MPGAVAADGATVESGHVSTKTARSNRSQIGFRIPVSTLAQQRDRERERERERGERDSQSWTIYCIDVSSSLTLSTDNDFDKLIFRVGQ